MLRVLGLMEFQNRGYLFMLSTRLAASNFLSFINSFSPLVPLSMYRDCMNAICFSDFFSGKVWMLSNAIQKLSTSDIKTFCSAWPCTIAGAIRKYRHRARIENKLRQVRLGSIFIGGTF